jgi:hypothetical protein
MCCRITAYDRDYVPLFQQTCSVPSIHELLPANPAYQTMVLRDSVVETFLNFKYCRVGNSTSDPWFKGLPAVAVHLSSEGNCQERIPTSCCFEDYVFSQTNKNRCLIGFGPHPAYSVFLFLVRCKPVSKNFCLQVVPALTSFCWHPAGSPSVISNS